MTKKISITIGNGNEEKKKSSTTLLTGIWLSIFLLGTAIIWLAPSSSVVVTSFIMATFFIFPIRSKLTESMTECFIAKDDDEKERKKKNKEIKHLSFIICCCYALLSIALYKVPLYTVAFLINMVQKIFSSKIFLLIFVIMSILAILAILFTNNHIDKFITKHIVGLAIIAIYTILISIFSWCGFGMAFFAIFSTISVSIIPSIFLLIWGLVLKKDIDFI